MKVLKNVRKDSTRKVRSDLLCVVKLTRRSVIFSEMPKKVLMLSPVVFHMPSGTSAH